MSASKVIFNNVMQLRINSPIVPDAIMISKQVPFLLVLHPSLFYNANTRLRQKLVFKRLTWSTNSTFRVDFSKYEAPNFKALLFR